MCHSLQSYKKEIDKKKKGREGLLILFGSATIGCAFLNSWSGKKIDHWYRNEANKIMYSGDDLFNHYKACFYKF